MIGSLVVRILRQYRIPEWVGDTDGAFGTPREPPGRSGSPGPDNAEQIG